MTAEEKARWVEVLTAAAEAGTLGRGSFYNDDGTPCCPTAHFVDAEGLQDEFLEWCALSGDIFHGFDWGEYDIKSREGNLLEVALDMLEKGTRWRSRIAAW